MLSTVLIVVVVLMLLDALPTWPHSIQWGYCPSGGRGLILLVLIILLSYYRIRLGRRLMIFSFLVG